MATKLGLFNEVLRICGERKLASLSENRESRRLLDDVWDGGAVDYCLEQGQWKFAMRASKIEDSPSIDTPFGYQHGFEQPTDIVRLSAICSDEYFNTPITRFSDENGFWFSDLDEMYIRYVSNDSTYGGDLGIWPQTFTRYVATYLANEVIDRLTQNASLWDKTYRLMQKRLTDARSKDAMAGPTTFLPTGRWVSSRSGGAGRDRGSRGSLIG